MLTPSNAQLWVNCSLAGNVIASGHYHSTPDAIPNDDDAKREGICAHWVAESMFNNRGVAARDMIGEQHKNGWVVDEEMAHHVASYVEYVEQFGTVTAAEKPVSLYDGLVVGRLDNTSTSGSILRIFDLKYGWKLKEAHHNYESLCYALAEWSADPWTVDAIEIHIYQPRPHHPDGPARVWRIERAEIQTWYAWLFQVATEARDNPRATVGDQCKYCPAAASCHALAAASYDITQTVLESRMLLYTPEQLAAELRFLEMAKKRIAARAKAIEAEATARLSKGQFIPGAVLEATKGNRQWKYALDKLAVMLGRPVHKEVPMSPAEMERAGVSKNIVNSLSERPNTGRKINLNPEGYAEKMFGKAR